MRGARSAKMTDDRSGSERTVSSVGSRSASNIPKIPNESTGGGAFEDVEDSPRHKPQRPGSSKMPKIPTGTSGTGLRSSKDLKDSSRPLVNRHQRAMQHVMTEAVNLVPKETVGTRNLRGGRRRFPVPLETRAQAFGSSKVPKIPAGTTGQGHGPSKITKIPPWDYGVGTRIFEDLEGSLRSKRRW